MRLVDKCSFCGKSERLGVRLVQGPSVAICEECVAFAYDEILRTRPKADHPEHQVNFETFGDSEAGGRGLGGK